jgi:hypothetical protein
MHVYAVSIVGCARSMQACCTSSLHSISMAQCQVAHSIAEQAVSCVLSASAHLSCIDLVECLAEHCKVFRLLQGAVALEKQQQRRQEQQKPALSQQIQI